MTRIAHGMLLLLKRISVSSVSELKEKLLEGIASLGRGEGIEGEKAFRHLRQRIKRRKVRE